MGLFDILRGARGAPGKDTRPEDYVSNATQFYFGRSKAGENVTPRTAVQTSTVYACVRVISETIASLPLSVYQYKGDDTVRAVKHPLERVLHDEANAEMTSFSWREAVLSHLLLWGNSYSQVIRDNAGRIKALYPLLPEYMTVDRDSETGAITYTYSGGKESVVLRPDQVLHIPGLGFDGVVGYSPVAMVKNTIGLTIAAEEYGSRFFENGAVPSGILSHPNTLKDPRKVSEAWTAAYGGISNRGKVAVLEEGMTFKQISMPNNEAQFLETRKFQVDEICRIFRVPPHMIGDLEHATYNNVEHQNINFAVYTIRPWVVRIEQAINRALFSEREKSTYFVRFNIDGLLRGSYKDRMDGYAVARQNGWMSANDIRALEGMNLISEEEGGNRYLINGNMVPITQAGVFYDTSATNEPEPADSESGGETK